MAGISDVVNGWLQGNNITDVTGNGNAPEEGVLQSSDSVELDSPDTGTGEPSNDSSVDSPDPSTDSVASKSSSKAATKTSPEKSPDKEEIVISDDKGRRKVSVDYTDKEQIRKYVQMAYGARKWQAERDQARQEVAPVRQQLEEMRSNWDTLESAFRGKGIEGVVDLLEGKQGAYQAHLRKAMDRADFLKRASPEEIDALEAKETAAAKSSENERIRKEFEEFKAKIEADKETADTKSAEARIHPTFDKYRFAGKLGNEKTEAFFDKSIWREAMDNLVPFEEHYGSASQIPQEIIDREFRQAYQTVRNEMRTQVESKTSKVLEQKKQEATENVQAKVQSGYQTGGARKEAEKLMGQGAGGINKILQNWGKYSSSFGKGK